MRTLFARNKFCIETLVLARGSGMSTWLPRFLVIPEVHCSATSQSFVLGRAYINSVCSCVRIKRPASTRGRLINGSTAAAGTYSTCRVLLLSLSHHGTSWTRIAVLEDPVCGTSTCCCGCFGSNYVWTVRMLYKLGGRHLYVYHLSVTFVRVLSVTFLQSKLFDGSRTNVPRGNYLKM